MAGTREYAGPCIECGYPAWPDQVCRVTGGAHIPHPTPPAPGAAREAPWYDEWLRIVAGTPGDGLHYVAPQQARGIQDAIAALRARAEAAERARDEAERWQKAAEWTARQCLDMADRLAAAEAHVARLTDALRAFTQPAGPVAEQPCEWVGTYCRTHDEWESCRYGIARAALAPAPETTTTETDR